MIRIQSDASIYDLVTAHPEIQDIMVNLGFRDIVKPGMLQTAGRMMTIKKGAAMKKIEWVMIVDVFKKNGYVLE